MENRFGKEITILPSLCDSAALLGIPDTFGLFMDVASEHAAALGCGIRELGEKGLFWLTVRTRVRFFRRPALMERVTLSTWPEAPGRLRAERDYLMEQEGRVLAAGKTEWGVLDQASGRLISPKEVYPPELAFFPETVWPEPFTRLPDEPMEEYARYAVRSVDMDLGEHMNNVAYIRSLAGTFSAPEWQAMKIRELEIAYRTSCHEGDVLIWQRRTQSDGSLVLRAVREDEKTAVQVRITPAQD